jgi:hypothetical protein
LRFASASSQTGHLGVEAFGWGSRRFSGRLPGLPVSSFSLVGFGGRPLGIAPSEKTLPNFAKKNARLRAGHTGATL